MRFILVAFFLAAWELRAADGWLNLFNGKSLSGWTRKAGDGDTGAD